jgi:hypothetical protein
VGRHAQARLWRPAGGCCDVVHRGGAPARRCARFGRQLLRAHHRPTAGTSSGGRV